MKLKFHLTGVRKWQVGVTGPENGVATGVVCLFWMFGVDGVPKGTTEDTVWNPVTNKWT